MGDENTLRSKAGLAVPIQIIFFEPKIWQKLQAWVSQKTVVLKSSESELTLNCTYFQLKYLLDFFVGIKVYNFIFLLTFYVISEEKKMLDRSSLQISKYTAIDTLWDSKTNFHISEILGQFSTFKFFTFLFLKNFSQREKIHWEKGKIIHFCQIFKGQIKNWPSELLFLTFSTVMHVLVMGLYLLLFI